MSDAVPTTTTTTASVPAPATGRRPARLPRLLFSFVGAAILFHARRYLDADMQKIMLAVLTALQDERDRAQERGPSAG
jgi:hypothetical protein